ncbi:hypothetical protein LR48_Vigan11g160500 [Vigna angularis]|uniref:Uncharacterized protein n=1 Tax=Phaseolus angularis TaxID=3914 RepID=A0A0L9VU16_PHAAN|nr:hypothetical protein LR48_Vigan11g160500 [Vigna angularis]
MLGRWQITYTLTEPEIAFTGDTMSDFIIDENNTDVLRAKILVLEVNYFILYFCGYKLLISNIEALLVILLP